jgi:hypothetical protein
MPNEKTLTLRVREGYDLELVPSKNLSTVDAIGMIETARLKARCWQITAWEKQEKAEKAASGEPVTETEV